MINLISIFLFSLKYAECANILAIFPTSSYSHQVVYRPLIKDLLKRGHTFTILTPNVFGKYNNANVTEIDIEILPNLKAKLTFNDYYTMNKEAIAYHWNKWKATINEEQLKLPQVQQLINDAHDGKTKFDLVILEYFSFLSNLAFAEIYDCPIVGVTSLDPFFYIHEDMGNCANPMIDPDFYLPYLSGELTFFQRIRSLIFFITVEFVQKPIQEMRYDRIIKQYFPNVTKSLSQLKERVQILLINASPIMKNRPLVANTIQVGLLHIEPAKPLTDENLIKFLRNSKDCVIYMSLGSTVQSSKLNHEFIQIFINVFSKINNCNILWKYEADNLPNLPKNIMISKWLPQSDLLAHPKIKIFITQGGQQSIDEAIDRSVPMIVIPFNFDQPVNAMFVAKQRIGYHLNVDSLSENELKNAIEEVSKIEYKENIIKLRQIIYDQPMSSREKAVWWIEYVLRHRDASHLKYSGRLMPFYQKLGIDILIFFILCILMIYWILKKIFTILKKLLKKSDNKMKYV